jgi:hypothetical protein
MKERKTERTITNGKKSRKEKQRREEIIDQRKEKKGDMYNNKKVESWRIGMCKGVPNDRKIVRNYLDYMPTWTGGAGDDFFAIITVCIYLFICNTGYLYRSEAT